jgi:hypothetical protein
VAMRSNDYLQSWPVVAASEKFACIGRWLFEWICQLSRHRPKDGIYPRG